MVQTRTIAVAYASIGSGPRIAAEALANELREDNDAVRVELVDILGYGRPQVSGEKIADLLAGSASSLADATWARPGTARFIRGALYPVLRAVYRGFTQWMLDTRPDVLVSTHPLPAALGIRFCQSAQHPCRVVGVPTDYGVHGFWPSRGLDLICVGDEHSREECLERGFAPASVLVTGIPVRSQFRFDYDRDASRRHFDLPTETRVLLAIAGSAMTAPYLRVKEALSVSLPALASLPNTSLAIVCGTDDELADELRSRAAGFGTTNVHVFGFTDHIAPLMSCSDLVMARPSGILCAEATSSGVPLVLLGPSRGRAKANIEAMLGAGTAAHCADPRHVADCVRKVVTRPNRLEKMRQASVDSSRPYAARDIADAVLGRDIAEEAPSEQA